MLVSVKYELLLSEDDKISASAYILVLVPELEASVSSSNLLLCESYTFNNVYKNKSLSLYYTATINRFNNLILFLF